MGLGLVYGGLRLPAGAEVLTSSHGHYSTHEAPRLRAARDGVAVRTIEPYKEPSTVSVTEVVKNLRAGISARTRIAGATWVHSSTGVKMPVRAMADESAAVTASASARRQDPREPHRVEHVRLAPGLLNTPEQLDEALASLARVPA